MRFEFATATRIIFGTGTSRETANLLPFQRGRALLLTGSNPTRASAILEVLRSNAIEFSALAIKNEPTLADIRAGVGLAQAEHCDCVIAIGGGSVMDAGKAIAAMLTNEGDVLDYLEVIGRGKSLTHPSAPVIAIPTTAGTGAEVTRNAVLGSPEHRVKVSLRSPLMLPAVALVDPELTCELPPALTASTGLDALTQLIEPYVCPRANPLTDGLCVEGLQRVARSLQTAFDHGQDMAAREDMAVASLHGGLALANAGLGAVHGFAGPIGGAFPAPHGAVCAALLPHVMALNLRALRERAPDADALRRYDVVARLLTGRPHATADDGIRWVRKLVADLGITPLSAYGLRVDDVPDLVAKASRASSMKANPIALTTAELTEVLRRALG